VDQETQKTIDLLDGLTRGAVARAKLEEVRAVRLNWIITGVAAALGLVFAAFATRTLVGPVRQLLGGTRAVESGNLEVSIDVKTPDELALLANSFNSMVAGLREKKRVTETFGKYVDPRIVSGLLENRLPAEGGQRQVMTVFFSDIAGFTRTCEGLMPDTAVRFLNGYFSFMSQIIRAEQGIIDKYIGDSVMAFWGPPFTDELRHAELCCRACLAQLQELEPFRRSLPELLGVRFGLPEVDVRMGIATGEVTVGNIGSDAARGYTVIGDTVNLASRLEQANKLYGTRVLVSEATRELAGDDLVFREVDSLQVLGKTEPVRVFELVGLPDDLSTTQEEGLKRFEAALADYRARHWERAENGFRQVLKVIPDDGPSRVLLKRIEAFKQVTPGDDWNGVWVAQSK
jgi:adenylate cyclase